MKLNITRINVNNVKKEIGKHYFQYRDIFYKMLIIDLCVYNRIHNNQLQNIVIEDGIYSQYYQQMMCSSKDVRDLISDIPFPTNMAMYLDLSVYIDEFISRCHDNNFINVYAIHITDTGYLIVSIRKLVKG